MSGVTKDEFKQVMGSFAAGVTVVTSVDGEGNPSGMTATAFSSVSMDPPLCLVCIDKRAGSHAVIAESRRFAVNFLRADQEELSNRFASRRDDKFDGIGQRSGEQGGCPLLADALATMECSLVEIFAGGDHDIFVGRLESCSVDSEAKPLLYWRGAYRQVDSS
jgi:flavin reductase (DIM6/NTAB) family NADH-FMN oxidoreductase RutF